MSAPPLPDWFEDAPSARSSAPPPPDWFEESAPEQPPAFDRFMAGAWQYLNPVNMARGVARAVAHPIDTAQAAVDAQSGQLIKAYDAAAAGEYGRAIGHGIAGITPLVGPASAAFGERINSGDVAGGLGEAAGLLGSSYLPVGAAKVAPAAGRAAAATGRAAARVAPGAIKGAMTYAATGSLPKAAAAAMSRGSLREIALRNVAEIAEEFAQQRAAVQAARAAPGARASTPPAATAAPVVAEPAPVQIRPAPYTPPSQAPAVAPEAVPVVAEAAPVQIRPIPPGARPGGFGDPRLDRALARGMSGPAAREEALAARAAAPEPAPAAPPAAVPEAAPAAAEALTPEALYAAQDDAWNALKAHEARKPYEAERGAWIEEWHRLDKQYFDAERAAEAAAKAPPTPGPAAAEAPRSLPSEAVAQANAVETKIVELRKQGLSGAQITASLRELFQIRPSDGQRMVDMVFKAYGL